ncbi:hypothetical protein PCANC_17019 [Puccinia coronata f. sp. avenae]|uniref:Uncharacterized protein n=1 Tax=Puccinia coronata f. sp. avenae TaxID=200324 RepID=A0A2N5SG83_9BASI|nr:hypothetical protein PCANC_17019 [Puccinia coronata f. sp. avenae]
MCCPSFSVDPHGPGPGSPALASPIGPAFVRRRDSTVVVRRMIRVGLVAGRVPWNFLPAVADALRASPTVPGALRLGIAALGRISQGDTHLSTDRSQRTRHKWRTPESPNEAALCST